MRPIEFRAWNKENKKWVDPTIVELWGIYNINESTLDEFMQFTGLLDKNGKKIWEGDILRFYDSMNEYEDFIGKVFWHEKDAQWVHTFLEGRPSKAFWSNNRWELEVIGNIFENPELLEEKL